MDINNSSILVVDDNPNNLDVLSDLLEHSGFEVLFALNGETALERAEFTQPDLILLDVMMPGIDGFVTCQKLKADPKTAHIPVIFMTALTDTMNKIKGFEAGAVDYVTKPIEAKEVLARVDTHLKIQRLQNDLRASREELKLKNDMLADRALHLEQLVDEKTSKIERLTITLVNALENANFYNDTDTGGHIKRISSCAAFLAERCGCERQFVKRVKLYASLHDVGKVGIPDALLKKPGKYTPEEFLAMQQHVVIGSLMLGDEDIDEMARHIALYHHEKWDGSGYVNQLQGEAIPLEARIVSIVDVYDALLSQRVYKPAFSKEDTERIIREGSGTHFDPALVKIFFKHIPEIQKIRQGLI